jgi:hypothetical protein
MLAVLESGKIIYPSEDNEKRWDLTPKVDVRLVLTELMSKYFEADLHDMEIKAKTDVNILPR